MSNSLLKSYTARKSTLTARQTLENRDQKILKRSKSKNNLLLKSFSLKQINKVKITNCKSLQGSFPLKITQNDEDHVTFLEQADQTAYFLEVVESKISIESYILPRKENFVHHCEGEIYKKTFFGNMNKCHAFISKTGLSISENKESGIFFYMEKIKELWTRFDTIKNQSFIVFKMKNGMSKHEIAVPVKDCLKWGQALCSLVRQ